MAETDKAAEKAKTSGIGYKGRVSVELRKGKKTVLKKTYSNAGGQPLFHFLSRCIVSNDFRPELAPRWIVLFYRENTSEKDVKNGIDGSSKEVSYAIYTNSGKVIDDPSNADNKTAAAYLHFTVPFSALHPPAGTTSTEDNDETGDSRTSSGITIYQAGLYNYSNATDNGARTNYSARFNFTNTNSATGLEEWDPITVPTDRGDYSLFIEWTMSFENN